MWTSPLLVLLVASWVFFLLHWAWRRVDAYMYAIDLDVLRARLGEAQDEANTQRAELQRWRSTAGKQQRELARLRVAIRDATTALDPFRKDALNGRDEK